MYFSTDQILRSIAALESVHSFHGITFLACKREALPVGHPTVFAMDSVTADFLQEFHRLDPASEWFFQPFKSADRGKKWLRPDYAAKGLQSVNTRTFPDAFIHPHNSRIWAWGSSYVDILAAKLPKKSGFHSMISRSGFIVALTGLKARLSWMWQENSSENFVLRHTS